MNTIPTLLAELAGEMGDRTAILAPGRQPLSYRALSANVERTAARLNQLGAGRGDRIAMALPNGPEMAVMFLASAAVGTCAPLNPAYRRKEYDFYLGDLNARVLVAPVAVTGAAVEAAASRGVDVIRLVFDEGAEAGSFTLEGPGSGASGGSAPPVPDDVALVLHTSGTTSRPKVVPLSQRNLCASARNIRTTLALTPDDRCLNVMPLFHIHGLIASLLSSLAAGASVVCTRGFDSFRFFAEMAEFQPTWFTAVPTMHQMVADRAERHRGEGSRRLRFVRSSSAPLPPRLMHEVESLFNVPMIEAYGMTEASHQMASNLLPPGERVPGSVGVEAGCAVAIMDEDGRLLDRGEPGEVVIRGEGVTSGYENNPEANRACFTNGWFRTGDQGHVDGRGFLFLSGRLKEIINRGGEKISPRQVDDVLSDHPAIRQVVTFALPHRTLGEDVGAAVVLREGAAATEREIRDFAAARLADFKVPRRVLFLDELPKGPTGKPQRIGLAGRLGLEA